MKISGIFLKSMALGALLLPWPVSAQQTRVLTAEKHNEYGLVYSLPNTALEITVTARHVAERGAPYFKYAKRYTGSAQCIAEDRDIWAITSVEITPYGVKDPDRTYLMQLKPGALTYISVGDDGMLLAINKDVAAPSALVSYRPTAPLASRTGREYLQYVNEDFISSQSSAKRAQMISESLLEVREAKISLTRGTAETMPSDGRQLELMLQSLAEQERALMEAFTGSVAEETVIRRYTYLPGDEESAVLFRFSDFAGFVESDDLRGDAVRIKVEVTGRGEMPVDAKGEEKRLPKDAVIYALPGRARFTLTCAGETLLSEELDIAQYGTEFGLAPQLFTDKKAPSWATFNPATGALEAIGTKL